MCPSSGSIYEPLKLSILQREDEPLWEKLDRYYSAGEYTHPRLTIPINSMRQRSPKISTVGLYIMQSYQKQMVLL